MGLGTGHLALGTTIALALGTCYWAPASAFELPAGDRAESFVILDVNNMDISEDGQLTVDMSLDFSNVKMKGNAETRFIPMYVNGTDTLRLESFSVAGRNRWYWDLRNQQAAPIMFRGWGKEKGRIYSLAGQEPIKQAVPTFDLSLTTPMNEWLEGATFLIASENYGCAGCHQKGEEGLPDFLPIMESERITHAAFIPDFIYVTPVAEVVKTREIAARAYIDFPVNRTEIYPDYRRNPQELRKIRATIDSIRNDKDITVRSLHISGTASPEGSYQNNVRLAQGRTEALKNYVQSLYHFPAGFISTSFEPVDWQGLREFLELVIGSEQTMPQGSQQAINPEWGAPLQIGNSAQSALPTARRGGPRDSIRMDQFQNIPGNIYEWQAALPSARQILNIVNGSVEPYQKNQNIKINYNSQYQWLLQNVYPALRHSDYRIQFEIRSYTDAQEIISVMTTQPQKLSLSELFVAANSQPEGSDLYNRAFELAVTMYPNDETANLNAGVTALKRGDMASAERYLGNAGNSAEADYNRGMMAWMQGDMDKAKEIFTRLATSSNSEVAERARGALLRLEDSLQPDSFGFKRIE